MRMPEQDLTCFGAHAVTGLLRHLMPTDLTRIRNQLEAVRVTAGMPLLDIGGAGDCLFFPQGPLVSIQQGEGVEIAVIGSEGFVGWPVLVGVTASPFRAVVRGREGIILRMPVSAVLAAIASSPRVGFLLHRFATVVGIQMAETLGACALRRIDIRLARWILLRHDRVGGDEIALQHEEVAANLGTRRASITDALHVIEGAGIVRCRRGRLLVRDRPGLEQLAGNFYGQAEAVYRLSIGLFGKPSAVTMTEPVKVLA